MSHGPGSSQNIPPDLALCDSGMTIKLSANSQKEKMIEATIKGTFGPRFTRRGKSPFSGHCFGAIVPGAKARDSKNHDRELRY